MPLTRAGPLVSEAPNMRFFRQIPGGWWATASLIAAALLSSGADAVPEDPPLRWWRGNLHTHTFWSDGNDFPEMIAEWYRTHGYHFLALSDHNILSEGRRWIRLSEVHQRGGVALFPAYQKRFGGGWVETRGGPGLETLEIRLKPLSEFRALVEQRGEFLMIPGEEVSDAVAGKPVHMNVTNVKELLTPVGGGTVREAIANNLRAAQEQAERSGQEILVHVNHPNFGLAITAEDLASVVAERFFEVYNGHPGVMHLGEGPAHPAVEELWDIANTIRIEQLSAAPLFGVATDDSHDYDGRPGSHTGRGWVMVLARYLTPESLIRALRAGEFYASSGVALREVSYSAESGTLRVAVEPQLGASYTIQFVGTRVGNRSSEPRQNQPRKPDVGIELKKVQGPAAEYVCQGDELYVRAVVTSSRDHPDPSFAGQRQQAWTQPVGWERRVPASP